MVTCLTGRLRRSGIVTIVVTFAALLGKPQTAPATELELKVVDERGETLPCRVLVRPRGGSCVVPEGATELVIGPDRWFMSRGTCRVEVPPGVVTVRVEHGHEYCRYKQDVEVAGAGMAKRITLRRWINMRRRGYLCGENHLHVDTQALASMLVCEGLDVGSSMTWFNGPDMRRPVPPGQGNLRQLEFAGRSTPTTIHDAELEYSWGAAYIQNLPAPFSLKTDRRRPNLDYLKEAVAADALVHYQAGWSREVAVDALLGYVHCVNVCNNNFHMHRYQQRSHYSNLLEVEGFPVYPNTEQGMMQMNTDTYYRLLNWGLRLAAGAGSATGVKQVPAGYNRAYVRAGAQATPQQFYRHWAAGRNFVTNGPVLLLKTVDGKRPGDIIELPADGGKVQLSIAVLSPPSIELETVEVIVNGSAAKSISVNDRHDVTAKLVLDITQGSWIAARCTAQDRLLSDPELAVYTQGSDQNRWRIRPARLRFAHTSPIYVNVDGRSATVSESIQEGLQMLDRFAAFARHNAAPEYQPDILRAIMQARQKLQSGR